MYYVCTNTSYTIRLNLERECVCKTGNITIKVFFKAWTRLCGIYIFVCEAPREISMSTLPRIIEAIIAAGQIRKRTDTFAINESILVIESEVN